MSKKGEKAMNEIFSITMQRANAARVKANGVHDELDRAFAKCKAAAARFEHEETTTTATALEAAIAEFDNVQTTWKLRMDELKTANDELGDLIGEGYLSCAKR